MNTELSFAGLYAYSARIIGSVLEDGPAGTVLSIDVGGSFFDCLASAASVAFDHEFEAFPSLLRYRSLVLDYRRPLRPADVIGEPPIFGRCDGWMGGFDQGMVFGDYELHLGAVAVRSVDAWSAGRSPLRLIHFGDAPLIADQIRGAEATLTRDRPVVTLYPPALSRDRIELLSLFEEVEYQAMNLDGSPVSHDGSVQPAGFGWMVLPKELSWPTPSHNLLLLDIAQQFSSPLEQAGDFDVLERQRRSSEVFGLGKIVPPALSATIPVNRLVACNDCYPIETDGKSFWRWLGPRPRARLAVPCAFPGTYRFEAVALSCRTEGGLGACRVMVEGREVPTTVQGEERGKITFVGRLDAASYEGYAEIDFVNRGSPPEAASDPRTLRMSLSTISISPCR